MESGGANGITGPPNYYIRGDGHGIARREHGGKSMEVRNPSRTRRGKMGVEAGDLPTRNGPRNPSKDTGISHIPEKLCI